MMTSSNKTFCLPFPTFLRSLLRFCLFFQHKHFSVMTLRKYSEGAFFFSFAVSSMLKASVTKLSVHQVGLLRPQTEM